MKIINPNVEIMHTGLETEKITPEQHIEKVGRTCYKSEDKITETSATKFVGNLIKRGHEAMIEHWSLIFLTDCYTYEDVLTDWNTFNPKPYIRFTKTYTDDGELRCVISGNMRAWRDYAKACIADGYEVPHYMWSIICDYPLFFSEFKDFVPAAFVNYVPELVPITAANLVGPVEHGVHHDVTVKFICDRGVSHEIVRHRTASFAQESTRYCNYSGDKYGKEITVVMPAKFIQGQDAVLDVVTGRQCDIGAAACDRAESAYFDLLLTGCTPQEARSVLPNSLKTEVIMTGNLNCWNHFFDLRCAPDAHPDIQVVAKMAKEEFETVVYPYV